MAIVALLIVRWGRGERGEEGDRVGRGMKEILMNFLLCRIFFLKKRRGI